MIKSDIKFLEYVYDFEDPKAIRKFLRSNEDLIQILTDAPSYIFHVFGAVPLKLELHRDPEEGWDELFLEIQASYSPQDVIKDHIKVFNEWYGKIQKIVIGRLTFEIGPIESVVIGHKKVVFNIKKNK